MESPRYTIKEIEDLTSKKVVDIQVKNRRIVLTLSTGIRISLPNWKTDE